MSKKWQTILLALSLSIFTWFLVAGREHVEIWTELPIVMTNPPEGLIIYEGMVERIQVRVRGPRGLVSSLSDNAHTYTLDVSDITPGVRVVELDPKNIPFSDAFEVVEIKPNRLTLSVDKQIEKTIDIIPVWGGKVNNYYEL